MMQSPSSTLSRDSMPLSSTVSELSLSKGTICKRISELETKLRDFEIVSRFLAEIVQKPKSGGMPADVKRSSRDSEYGSRKRPSSRSIAHQLKFVDHGDLSIPRFFRSRGFILLASHDLETSAISTVHETCVSSSVRSISCPVRRVHFTSCRISFS